MVILVTGATGFVGGYLTRRLLDQGHKPRLLVRNPDKAEAFRQAGAEVVKGDLLDAASVARAMQGCDTVYHVAAQMLKEGLPRAHYVRANVDTTRNMVDAAVAAGVKRFVHVSTAGVYGRLKKPVDETSSLSPSSAYRETKALSEQICLEAHAKSGFPVVIARLSPVIGPHSNNFLGLSRALSKGQFRAIGDGSNLDHITPVTDIAKGINLCGEVPDIEGNIYLIAGDTVSTTHEILKRFTEALGAPAPVGALPNWPYRAYTRLSETLYKAFRVELPFVYRYAFFLANKSLLNGKAKRDLGFYPTAPLPEAIAEAVAYYRQAGLL